MVRHLLVFVLLIASCFSSGMVMDSSVDDSGNVEMGIKVELPVSAMTAVNLTLNGPVDSVIVKDRSGLVIDSQVVRQGNGTVISAIMPYDYLEYSIHSDSLTGKEGSVWDVDLLIGFSKPLSNFSGTLHLPKGALVRSSNGALAAEGDSILVAWKASNISESKKIHLKAGYEMTSESSTDYLPYRIGIIALAILLALFYGKSRLGHQESKGILDHAPAEKPDIGSFQPKMAPETIIDIDKAPRADARLARLESNDIFKTLDETDKELLREIMRQGGKTTQAHLNLNTHIAKATLSRRLDSLEGRGLIQKSQKGIRNLVSLSDMLMK